MFSYLFGSLKILTYCALFCMEKMQDNTYSRPNIPRKRHFIHKFGIIPLYKGEKHLFN